MSVITSIVFGDIFKYEGREYIFLVQTDSITYAARILETTDSKNIDRLYEKRVASNSVLEKNILYCYVKLETAQFKDRIAHFKNTGQDDFRLSIEKLPYSLDAKDKKQIKEEVLRKDNPVNIGLKELVKDIIV